MKLTFTRMYCPYIIDDLNRIHDKIYEIYDAYVAAYRRIIIRVNRLLHDTIKVQKITRTSIRAGNFPCPVCMVSRPELLSSMVDAADRDKKWEIRSMGKYIAKQAVVLAARPNCKERENICCCLGRSRHSNE